MNRSPRRPIAWLAAVLFAALSCPTLQASAQEAPDFAEVEPGTGDPSPSPQGAIGLGLIGAELGLVVPALLGGRSPWLFIVFPAIGGAGGAVAGHLAIDEGVGSPVLSAALLGLGMALVIPAVVATLQLAVYDPVAPRASLAPSPGGTQLRPSWARVGGLLRWREGEMGVGMPALAAVPVYSQAELRQLGNSQQTEWRLSVLSGSF